jgi:heptosyltransferase-2
LVTPSSASVLRGIDSIDEVLCFDKFAFDRPADAGKNVLQALQLRKRLRNGNWDTLVLLHHLTTKFGIAKYAALALSSGATTRVGLDNGRGGWFLTHAAADHGFGWRHDVDYQLDVVRVLGAKHPLEQPRLELAIFAEDEDWAAATWAELAINGDAVLLGPGSGAFSQARRWAPERFAEVGRTLAERGLTPVILGGVGVDEQRIAQHVAATIGARAKILGKAPSPQALGALIKRCKLLIANDSGPVHLASAIGTPVVAIFGPSNDRAWGPYPPALAEHVVVREQLACTPCIHRGHAFGTPQGCPARTCLAILEVPSVVKAAAAVLAA